MALPFTAAGVVTRVDRPIAVGGHHGKRRRRFASELRLGRSIREVLDCGNDACQRLLFNHGLIPTVYRCSATARWRSVLGSMAYTLLLAAKCILDRKRRSHAHDTKWGARFLHSRCIP